MTTIEKKGPIEDKPTPTATVTAGVRRSIAHIVADPFGRLIATDLAAADAAGQEHVRVTIQRGKPPVIIAPTRALRDQALEVLKDAPTLGAFALEDLSDEQGEAVARRGAKALGIDVPEPLLPPGVRRLASRGGDMTDGRVVRRLGPRRDVDDGGAPPGRGARRRSTRDA